MIVYEALLALVGTAILEVSLHSGLDEVKRTIGKAFDSPERLRNHDVQRAIRRALRASAQKLQKEYKALNPKDPTAKVVFAGLENYDLAAGSAGDDGAASWLSKENLSGTMPKVVAALCPYASAQLQSFLTERLPPMFVFAFREIGLKANEKVRAVIFESMFQQVIEGNARLEELIGASDIELEASLTNLGFTVSASHAAIGKLLEDLRELRVLISASHLGGGPVLAYLRVNDLNDNTLQTVSIRTKDFEIGRGRAVAVSLDHARVGRIHARISIDGAQGEFLIEDRKSKHGTWVSGESLTTPTRLSFGTPIVIDPFTLTILAPDASPDELRTGPTDDL